MSLNRSEKEAVISDVTSLAAKAQTLVMAEYRGITVADMTKLRTEARSKGVTLSVLKNTLARRAVAGSAFEVVGDQMTGPLIYGFSVDAVAAAKVVADFAKTNDKLVIRGGAFGGKEMQPHGYAAIAAIEAGAPIIQGLAVRNGGGQWGIQSVGPGDRRPKCRPTIASTPCRRPRRWPP